MAIGSIAPISPPHVPHGIEVIKILVGPDKTPFTVHKDLLCAASAFFTSALQGRFIEAQEQTINLPEDQPAQFQLFVDWLYTGRLVNGPHVYMTQETKCFSDEFWLEINLMADRLMIPRLKNLAQTRLRELFSHREPLVPSKEFIVFVFERSKGSLRWLELYLADHITFWMDKTENKDVWENVLESSDKLSVLVAKSFMRQRGTLEDFRMHPGQDFEKWQKEDKDRAIAFGEVDEDGEQWKTTNNKPVRGKQLERAKLIKATVGNLSEDVRRLNFYQNRGWSAANTGCDAYEELYFQHGREQLDRRMEVMREQIHMEANQPGQKPEATKPWISEAAYRQLGMKFSAMKFASGAMGEAWDDEEDDHHPISDEACAYLLRTIEGMRSRKETAGWGYNSPAQQSWFATQ